MSSGPPVVVLLLAVTFAAAAGRKLADPLGARRELTAIGVPHRAAGPVVSGLTLGELGLDLAPVLIHFSEFLPPERVQAVVAQAFQEHLSAD